jgi:nucleosome assembly protein 1-like 1
MPDEKELAEPKEAEDEEEKDMGERMDEDFEIGNEIKDQLIPLALEYYLEVIEEEEDEDHEGCGDSCDDDHDDKDSEEEEKPKGGKKSKKGGAAGKQAPQGGDQ